MILCDTSKTLTPDLKKNCQIEPNSQVQLQHADFILEFKSTHPIGGTSYEIMLQGLGFFLKADAQEIELKHFSLPLNCTVDLALAKSFEFRSHSHI